MALDEGIAAIADIPLINVKGERVGSQVKFIMCSAERARGYRLCQFTSVFIGIGKVVITRVVNIPIHVPSVL